MSQSLKFLVLGLVTGEGSVALKVDVTSIEAVEYSEKHGTAILHMKSGKTFPLTNTFQDVKEAMERAVSPSYSNDEYQEF